MRTLAVRWAERDPSRHFLLPDFTGHGDSPALPEEGATLGTLAEDVLQTARSAGMKGPLSIIGHSLGGRVALEALRHHAPDVSEIALLDISPGAIDPAKSDSGKVLRKLCMAPEEAPDRATMRQALLDTGLSPPTVEWLLTNLVPKDGGFTWRMNRGDLERFHSTAIGADLWELADPIPVRAICLRGSLSHYVSDADAAHLARAGFEVETLEGAGHYVHVDTLGPLLEHLVRWSPPPG